MLDCGLRLLSLTCWTFKLNLWPCLCFLLACCANGLASWDEDLTPRALHTALNGSDAVTCVWYTSARTVEPWQPVCQYGRRPDQLDMFSVGRSYWYPSVDDGFTGTLHEVLLAGVASLGTVFYRCRVVGVADAPWSPLFWMELRSSTVLDAPLSGILLVGDMGLDESEATMKEMERSLVTGRFGDLSLTVHAGDITYAYDHFPAEDRYRVWVKYFDRLQPLVARAPYMTCPGNHEAPFNFTSYANWLRMPHRAARSPSPFWYSFDYLGVHFVMMSTEHVFSPGSPQHRWMEADLRKANSRRHQVPWLVVVGHRPLYCSSWLFAKRCTTESLLFRTFLEDLFLTQRVDVYLCGHNHQYERSYPVYRGAFMESYSNPNSTVYIVNGAAGNIEQNDPTHMRSAVVPWRAAYGHGMRTGFLVMTPARYILNFTYVESSSGKVMDHFAITR